jgi:hypothetical protein
LKTTLEAEFFPPPRNLIDIDLDDPYSEQEESEPEAGEKPVELSEEKSEL